MYLLSILTKFIRRSKTKRIYKLYGKYPEMIPQKILGSERFVGLDIGAAVEIPWHWSEMIKFGFIYAVEPHKASANLLREKYKNANYAVLEEALSVDGGIKTLYLTNTPTGSSLLEPNLEYIYGDPNYFVPWKTEEIKTKTAEEVARQYGILDIDSVKIDTQGTELEILSGFGDKYLGQILSVEFEAGVPGAYKEQTEFFRTHEFMGRYDFELFDLKPARANIYFKDGIPYKRAHTVSSKIHEVDVLYFKKLDVVLDSRDRSKLIKLIVAYCVYSFFDEAYLAIDKGAAMGLLDSFEQESYKQAVVEWHDYKSYFKYHWFNYGA